MQNEAKEGPARRPSAGTPSQISSRELFRKGREITIDHEGETYRLRVTKNGKLILTK